VLFRAVSSQGDGDAALPNLQSDQARISELVR
jgi:hypothetical protein